MKKLIVSIILLCTMGLSGCGDKQLTLIYFTDYNQLENPEGKYRSGDEFTFQVNGKRYEVMDGYAAEYLRIIKENEDNVYKLIMADSSRRVVFSMVTKKEGRTVEKDGKNIEGPYEIEAVRECTDIDDKIYILYSKYDTMIGNLFIEDLKSTHILEMDMDNYIVKQQYDFGKSVVVLTIHDGYVYTMEAGKVYRELLGQTGNKECMADLGFRGMPDIKEIDGLTFSTEVDGIKVIATVPDDQNEYIYKNIVLADIKYTDSPIESE